MRFPSLRTNEPRQEAQVRADVGMRRREDVATAGLDGRQGHSFNASHSEDRTISRADMMEDARTTSSPLYKPSEKHRRPTRTISLSAHTLILIVFSVPVLLVCALAFVPIYWLMRADSVVAVGAAQREMVSGLAVTVDLLLSRTVATAVTSLTMLRLESPEHLPRTRSDVLAPMANILSLPPTNVFADELSLCVAIPGSEWRAVATPLSYNDATSGVVVGIQSNLTSPFHWSMWQPFGHTLTPLLTSATKDVDPPDRQQSLATYLYDVRSAYQAVPVDWNRSTRLSTLEESCGPAAPTAADQGQTRGGGDTHPTASHLALSQWGRFHAHPRTFFGLVTPFCVMDADGKRGVAYYEVTLHIRRVAEEVLRYYQDFSRPHHHFLVMDTRSQLVSVNSWNQSQTDPFRAFPASDINSPMMRAAATQYLDHHRATVGTGTMSAGATVSFDFAFPPSGDRCKVFAHTIRNMGNSTLVVLVAAKESDLFSSVALTARALVAIVTTAVAVVIGLVSVGARKLVAGLDRLVASIEDTLVLRVDGAENELTATEAAAQVHALEYSLFRGRQRLSDALVRLRRRMQEVKSILPDSLTIEAQSSFQRSTATVDPHSSSFSTTAEASSSRGEASDRGRPRNRAQLNLAVLNERVNVFHRRYCSCVWACRYYTNDINAFSFQEFFEAGHAAALEFDGCLEFFRPDYIVISFGAHIHMPMHSVQACMCAMSFWNRLSARNQSQLVLLLDSKEFCVGTCGKQNGRKRRVVFDVTSYMNMLRLLQFKGVHNVTATQRAVAYIPEHLSVPYDFIKTSARDSSVLFELRGPVPIDPVTGLEDKEAKTQMDHDARLFRVAFHEMRTGRYKQAAQLYAQMSAHDALAARLESYCNDQVTKRRFSPFVSRPPEVRFHWSVRCLGSPFIRPVTMMCINAVKSRGRLSTLPSCSPRTGASGGEAPQKPSPNSTDKIPPTQPTASGADSEPLPDDHPTGSRPHSPHVTTDSAPMAARRAEESVTRPSGSVQSTHRVVTPPVGGESEEADLQELTDEPAPPVEMKALSSNEDQDSVASVGAAGLESFATPVEHFLTTFYEDAPAELVDSHGVRWVLSQKPLGYTCIGARYAVLSEVGMKAQLEWIPRHCSALCNDRLREHLDGLEKLQHANLLQYIGYAVSSTAIAHITEDARGGTLHDILAAFGPLDYLTIRRYTLDILLALVYLHAVDTVHGDLNLYTVLIGDEGVCKLSEVGRHLTLDRPVRAGQTRFTQKWAKESAVHMAPEVAAGGPRTHKSDIYALGVLVLELALGFVPMSWKGKPNIRESPLASEMLDNIDTFTEHLAAGDLAVALPADLTSNVEVFVLACCQRDPEKRATAQELFSFPLVL